MSYPEAALVWVPCPCIVGMLLIISWNKCLPQASKNLTDWRKVEAWDERWRILNHRIIEQYKHRISWVGKFPQWSLSPTQVSKQNHPKFKPSVWEHYSNTPWTLAVCSSDHCPVELIAVPSLSLVKNLFSKSNLALSWLSSMSFYQVKRIKAILIYQLKTLIAKTLQCKIFCFFWHG